MFARMVWGTYLEKFKWAICLIVGGSKCLPGWFGALVTIKTVIWQSCSIRSENKVPQSARLTEGRGVQSLFGQCPFEPGDNFRGASLSARKPIQIVSKLYPQTSLLYSCCIKLKPVNLLASPPRDQECKNLFAKSDFEHNYWIPISFIFNKTTWLGSVDIQYMKQCPTTVSTFETGSFNLMFRDDW